MRLLALALITATLAAPAIAAPRHSLAPGEQSCVNRRQVRTIEPAPQGQLIFRMSGGPDYRANLRTACDYNPDMQIIINRDFGGSSQYCEGDLLELQDRTSGMYSGTCSLDGFTPLPKPERAPHP